MKKKEESVEKPKPERKFVPSLVLCGVNTPECVQIFINKEHFVLGKEKDCDGVLGFNREISRHHCVIDWKDGRYWVTDTGSTNGTFHDDTRMEIGKEYQLLEGDSLRLSTTSFTIERVRNVPSEDVF